MSRLRIMSETSSLMLAGKLFVFIHSRRCATSSPCGVFGVHASGSTLETKAIANRDWFRKQVTPRLGGVVKRLTLIDVAGGMTSA